MRPLPFLISPLSFLHSFPFFMFSSSRDSMHLYMTLDDLKATILLPRPPKCYYSHHCSHNSLPAQTTGEPALQAE